MQMPGSSIIQHPIPSPDFSILLPSLLHASCVPNLSAREAALLCHGGVLLLETLAESLGALEELVDAAHDAALLLGEKRLGGEVGDAVGEAALDEVRVHLNQAKKISFVESNEDMVGFARVDVRS
jgi:hypothetical protein